MKLIDIFIEFGLFILVVVVTVSQFACTLLSMDDGQPNDKKARNTLLLEHQFDI